MSHTSNLGAVAGQSMQRDRQEQGADCNRSAEESPAAARIRQAFAELGQVCCKIGPGKES